MNFIDAWKFTIFLQVFSTKNNIKPQKYYVKSEEKN